MPDHAPDGAIPGGAIPGGVIVVAGRTFVARRKAGRPRAGTVPLSHAVTPRCRMALCAAEPGAGSAWAEPPEGRVTCPACLRRLDRLRAN